MAPQAPGGINLPPPAFPQGPPSSPSPSNVPPSVSPNAPRKSFGARSRRRSSLRAKFSMPDEEMGEDDVMPSFEPKPPIPSALPNQDDTPLPILPMIVLSIALLGEFLSANVSTPFLLFMVEGFGIPQDDVGAQTGILVSTFFITQFLTSVLWATIADKHGRRAVLFASLLGNSLTCLAFGTATTFQQAVVIRLLQGVFNGSIGVARGAVTAITDSTNEARAYATIGFCWGLGGVAGAVIGGAFESPAKRWPGGIGSIGVFVTYPYLLPCAVAASVTFLGAVLSLFLGWDGGPREGLIRLPIEKDEGILPTVTELRESPDGTPAGPRTPEDVQRPLPETVVDRVVEGTKQVQKKISGYFARRVRESWAIPGSPARTPQAAGSQPLPVPGSARSRARSISHMSQRSGPGSAYGYSGGLRRRLASNLVGSVGTKSPGVPLGGRRMTGQSYLTDEDGAAREDLNFAQRLLLANEGNVTSMANLWVAAAINADNEDPFFDSGDVTPAEEQPTEEQEGQEGQESESVFLGEDEESRPVTPAPPPGGLPLPGRPSFGSASTGARPRPSPRLALGGFGLSPFTHIATSSPRTQHSEVASPEALGTPRLTAGTPRIAYRRGSSASNLMLPSIYNNTGLSSPPALATELQPAWTLEEHRPSFGGGSALSRISEGSGSMTEVPSGARSDTDGGTVMQEPISVPQPSLWKQLPFVIIFQYGILALHGTVHDQYFLTYLVSPYDVGGLGLNAAHFAQLIALMCFAQIFYQFYLYPNIGPPRGAWSHLAMFRIGSALYIPSYLSVILYHAFASNSSQGNLLVMVLLTISTAVRFCAATFTYTAVAILLNYMSPPHLVSLSNSIGQSTVALARFVGPVIGGYLWSASIKNGPEGYPFGFYVVSIACALAIAHSFTIR